VTTEGNFLLDLIQEIAGKDAYKRALFNIRHRDKLPDKERTGTLVELVKQTMAKLESQLLEKFGSRRNSELTRLDQAVEKVK